MSDYPEPIVGPTRIPCRYCCGDGYVEVKAPNVFLSDGLTPEQRERILSDIPEERSSRTRRTTCQACNGYGYEVVAMRRNEVKG